MFIAEKKIGLGHPCYIIAEIGQGHDGSLGLAHSYIDAVAATGADAIKFQTHIAQAESTVDEPFRLNFSYEDKTRFDYWKRMEFTPDQWRGLADHCKEVNLTFLSSAFSVEAVHLLDDLGMPAYKVGSGEVSNPLLIEAITRNKKPVLLSTGMSGWTEIDGCVDLIKATGSSFALFQCTSKYPTCLSDIGLNVIDEFRARYGCPVGLSDHSGLVHPAVAAMARGADIVEIHVVFSKQMFGPDTAASLTMESLRQLVDARNAFHKMICSPVSKDQMADELKSMRLLFNKSVALKKPMSAGEKLTRDDLTVKKPGTGIPAAELESCIGKTLTRDVSSDKLLEYNDLEELDG